MSDANQAERLRGRLQATIDHVAQQYGARKLCLALALAEGFQFQLVICNSPRAAAALQLWLEQAVALERGTAVRLERRSPYPLDPSAAGPASLDATELVELVLGGLLTASTGDDRFYVVDASRAQPRDIEAWRALLSRFNERRNLIARDLDGSLTVIVPPWLGAEFARLAPDLWSIRSVVVDVRDLDDVPAAGLLLQSFEAPYRTSEDIPALREEVARVRTQTGGGGEGALRVLLLRLAGALRLSGELSEAEQLIEEARALARRLADPGALVACELALSDILVIRGELDEARRLIDSTIRVLVQLGDDWALANAWGRLADILRARGELDEALRIHREEQLPVYERLGDVRERAVTMGRVADILYARGELDEALRIRREELPVYERLGDVRSRTVTMGRVADILEARGELDEPLRIRREEQLPVYEQLGDVRERALTMGKVADILDARGELDEALRIRREEELPVYERLGDVRSRALTMGKVANILHARGELDEALRIRREAELPVYERLGEVRLLIVGRTNLAITLLTRARPSDRPEAVDLLVQALRDARSLRLREAEQIAAIIRQHGLDPEQPPFV